MQVYPIDFVRQLLVQTLYEMNYDNGGKTFGGSDQVNLFSFYEQLEKQDEVDRFVEMYRDLTNQENRAGLIMNGVVIAPENPTITNLYQELIVPLTFTCSFRVRLGDRDKAQETINQLIRALKGRKFDMGLCENGEIIKVGTIGHGPLNSNINSDYSSVEENSSNLRKIQKRAYIGSYNISNMTDSLELTRTQLIAKGFDFTDNSGYYYAIRYNNGGLYVVNYNSTTNKWVETTKPANDIGIVFPKDSTSPIHKYKLSISFDSIRCDEPRTLNADEYCTISFGGSATLVSYRIMLGNDLVQVGILKNKIVAGTDIQITTQQNLKFANSVVLEPLEMPSSNNANTQINQLLANKFVSNSHTDSIAISNQYTFIVNKNIDIIWQFFKYARYGIQADGTSVAWASGVSPNMIFTIWELWSSWGETDLFEYNAKVVESVDIENTESDTLSITIPFQIQGANN